MRRPSRLSKDFQMNDIYFYCALLYSLWTGKCWKKDYDEENADELAAEFAKNGIECPGFAELMETNLKETASWKEGCGIRDIMDSIWNISRTQK